jgi:hypothetical protein
MELSARPLFDNPLDAALYVERPETEHIKANCRDGVNTLITGPPGIGKTTLLRQVLYQLREEGFPAVGVDAGPAEGVLELVQMISAAIGPRMPAVRGIDPLSLVGLGETGSVLAEIRHLQEVAQEEPRTAILLDLSGGQKDAHRLFGKFRDELWQAPFTWVVAAPRELRGDLSAPPADAFFADLVEVAPLNSEQQDALIAARLELGEQTPWRLPDQEEGNPRRLLEIVRNSIRAGHTPEQELRARAKREAEVSRLGRSASMLYSVLSEYGPASASDEEFLNRLGFSRQRAAKLLALLEREEFVTSETRAGEGGRPRKVFTIVPTKAR